MVSFFCGKVYHAARALRAHCALRAAHCETYGATTTQHPDLLCLPLEQRVQTLAVLAVSVPGGAGGALEPGFTYLRLALDHDVAAAA